MQSLFSLTSLHAWHTSGLDLCYGRWDDHNHALTDFGSATPSFFGKTVCSVFDFEYLCCIQIIHVLTFHSRAWRISCIYYLPICSRESVYIVLLSYYLFVRRVIVSFFLSCHIPTVDISSSSFLLKKSWKWSDIWIGIYRECQKSTW